MDSTFVFDSQIASCALLTSVPTASAYEKICFLCNIKEIGKNCLVDSQECSLILCQILNVPHLINDLKRLESVNYCHPCKKRILKIHESLNILEKLEKEVLDEKYLIRLQLETNYKIVSNEFYYSPSDFGVKLVNEMRFKSIKSKLEKVIKNQIGQKFNSMTNDYQIMKDITITEKLKPGTFEEHISEKTTPLPICNFIISTEKQTLINDNLSFPNNCHFVESATNSPFNQAELTLTPCVFNLDDIKLELLSEETNNTTDIKDPFEGIDPESGFVTENSTTRKTFICGTCETNFHDYSQLDEHCCTHINSKSNKLCPNESVSKVSLNTSSYIHAKSLLKCRYCMKVFPNQFRLKTHERIHSVETFKCGYCEKTFRLLSDLKRHEHIHKEEKPFKCKFCEKNFFQKSQMEYHERIHTYKCGNCDKTFRTTYAMKKHEHIHKDEKPFKCKFCEKTFSQKGYMETHERIHTNEKPFKCGLCDKTFRSLTVMKRHEDIHKEEKRFKCKFCEKTFSRKSSMETHERIHTNEKPFSCGHCDKMFRCLSAMKTHENIHKEDNPFKCKFCEKSFSHKSHMERHGSIHTNEKPFNADTVTNHFEIFPI